MTTVTEPPLITPAIDVAELPALDQPDERVCELEELDERGGDRCGQPAVWAITTRCGCCARNLRELICEWCHTEIVNDEVEICCDGCDAEVAITWIERIR